MRRNRFWIPTLLALLLTPVAARADHAWTARERARLAALDRNGDGAITQREWRGSTTAFRNLDWNHDGVLAGREIGVMPARARAARPALLNREQYFRMLDRNHDGWIAPYEYDDREFPFAAADLDRNGFLSWTEWRDSRAGARRNQPYESQYYADRYRYDDDDIRYRYDDDDIDSERLSDFLRLDRNDDEFLTRAEWRGSFSSFARLDRDRDGLVHITEYLGG